MKLLLTNTGASIIENSVEAKFYVDNEIFVRITQDQEFASKVLQELAQGDSVIIGSLGTQKDGVYIDDLGIALPDLDNKILKKNSFGFFQKLE